MPCANSLAEKMPINPFWCKTGRGSPGKRMLCIPFSKLHMQVLWLNCLALAACEQLGRATPETAKKGALQEGLW